MMNIRLLLALILLLSSGFMGGAEAAPEKPHKKMTLAEKGEQARQESVALEQAQLQKAREAVNATSEREQKVLAKQQSRDWETQQREKAQVQFDERAKREQKYLHQAQDAASQTRKIPKEISETDPKPID